MQTKTDLLNASYVLSKTLKQVTQQTIYCRFSHAGLKLISIQEIVPEEPAVCQIPKH